MNSITFHEKKFISVKQLYREKTKSYILGKQTIIFRDNNYVVTNTFTFYFII